MALRLDMLLEGRVITITNLAVGLLRSWDHDLVIRTTFLIIISLDIQD